MRKDNAGRESASSLAMILSCCCSGLLFFVETESHSVVHELHPGLTVLLGSLEHMAFLGSQFPKHWNCKHECHHVRGYFSPFAFSGRFMKLKVFSYVSVSEHTVISTAQASDLPTFSLSLGPQARAATLSSSVMLL